VLPFSALPAAQGLYDPQSERDACGLAMVADLRGRPTHGTVTQALAALHNLRHRGAAGQPLMRFKPWMLAIALQGLELQKAGYDPELGLDKHFYDQAKASGKAVQGLETADYQISVFDGMTMEQQERLLAQTLKELETELASVGKLADAWKSGDAPTVERIVQSELKAEPQMYQRLLVDRNKAWLPKIEALFARTGRALVVVGAAHLVGPDGLVAMLKAKGYTVEQM